MNKAKDPSLSDSNSHIACHNLHNWLRRMTLVNASLVQPELLRPSVFWYEIVAPLDERSPFHLPVVLPAMRHKHVALSQFTRLGHLVEISSCIFIKTSDPAQCVQRLNSRIVCSISSAKSCSAGGCIVTMKTDSSILRSAIVASCFHLQR